LIDAPRIYGRSTTDAQLLHLVIVMAIFYALQLRCIARLCRFLVRT